MKKLIYTLLFVSTAILTSCSSDDDSSSDDDGSTNLSNEISIDGEISSILSGTIQEFGTGIETGYFNNDFTLSGLTGDGDVFSLYAELFSIEEGNDGFTTGTFVLDEDSITPDYFFETATLNIVGENTLFVEAGTVTISGTSSNYVYEANLTFTDLSGNVTINVEAQYSGDFN